MDPNLETIFKANERALKVGNVGPAIQQAKDYLVYYLGYEKAQLVEPELDEFAVKCRLAAGHDPARPEKKKKTYSGARPYRKY